MCSRRPQAPPSVDLDKEQGRDWEGRCLCAVKKNFFPHWWRAGLLSKMTKWCDVDKTAPWRAIRITESVSKYCHYILRGYPNLSRGIHYRAGHKIYFTVVSFTPPAWHIGNVFERKTNSKQKMRPKAPSALGGHACAFKRRGLIGSACDIGETTCECLR